MRHKHSDGDIKKLRHKSGDINNSDIKPEQNGASKPGNIGNVGVRDLDKLDKNTAAPPRFPEDLELVAQARFYIPQVEILASASIKSASRAKLHFQIFP